MEEAPQWHRNGTLCRGAVAHEAEQFILTDCFNGVLLFFLVTVITQKRSNTTMATATKIALSRSAQVS